MNIVYKLIILYVASAILARLLHRKLYLPGGLFYPTQPGVADLFMIFMPGVNTLWLIGMACAYIFQRLSHSTTIKSLAKRILGL